MSVTEALRAATVGGAQALRAPDRGAMVRGRFADIVAWDADHEGAFAWSYGLKPIRVWRGGEPVRARASAHPARWPARPRPAADPRLPDWPVWTSPATRRCAAPALHPPRAVLRRAA